MALAKIGLYYLSFSGLNPWDRIATFVFSAFDTQKMTEGFTNNEIPMASLPRMEKVQFHKVSRRLLWRSLTVVSSFLIVVMILSGWYFFYNPMNRINTTAILLLLLFFLLQYLNVILKQRHYEVALREKDILYRRGYIISRTTIITFNRVQHSSISRSLFDKIFGIATLKIYTAGGKGSDMSIPGLLPQKAKNLHEELSKKVGIHEY